MTKKFVFFALAMVVVLAILGIYFFKPFFTSDSSFGRPAPIILREQPEQANVQTSEGSFSVRAIVATPQKITFFYAVKASQGSVASASFLPDVNLKNSLTEYKIPIVNTVQGLGKLGDYEVGLIQSDWTHQPGQTFTLQTKDAVGNTWVTTPLIETKDTSDVHGTTFITLPSKNAAPIEVQWGVMGPTSIGKILVEGQDSNPILFISMDTSMNISMITEIEYNSIYAKSIKANQ